MSRNSLAIAAQMCSIQRRNPTIQAFNDRRDKGKHGYLRRVMRPVSNMNTLDDISATIEIFLQRLVAGMEKEARENEGLLGLKNWLYNFTFAVGPVYFHLIVDNRIPFFRARI